ncbi:MAG: hypothetical protein ACREHG_06710 [Candidatus Saccharimonadales bacterium]
MYQINQIHDILFFLADKQQNQFFSHEDVDLFLDFYQMALFSKLTGRPEANAGYFPPQKSGVRQDQWFNDALNPFKKVVNFLYEDAPGGVITLPTDYIRLNSLYTQLYSNKSSEIEYKGVQVLGDDLVADRLSSQILTPSLGKPFAQWIGTNTSNNYLIQLYPKQPMAGYYNYLSRPATPKYNYTMNGRQVVFEPEGSVDLAWNDELQIQIIMSTLQALGINSSDQTLIQLSQLKQKEGAVS